MLREVVLVSESFQRSSSTVKTVRGGDVHSSTGIVQFFSAGGPFTRLFPVSGPDLTWLKLANSFCIRLGWACVHDMGWPQALYCAQCFQNFASCILQGRGICGLLVGLKLLCRAFTKRCRETKFHKWEIVCHDLCLVCWGESVLQLPVFSNISYVLYTVKFHSLDHIHAWIEVAS